MKCKECNIDMIEETNEFLLMIEVCKKCADRLRGVTALTAWKSFLKEQGVEYAERKETNYIVLAWTVKPHKKEHMPSLCFNLQYFNLDGSLYTDIKGGEGE
jgi:hypothetical protein